MAHCTRMGDHAVRWWSMGGIALSSSCGLSTPIAQPAPLSATATANSPPFSDRSPIWPAVKSPATAKPAALWHRLAQHHQYRIRSAVERGWQAVANIRAERQADSVRGRQLVVLLEHADLLIARTVAFAEHLEHQAAAESSPCFDRGMSGLDELRSTESWIASMLVRRRRVSLAAAQSKQAEMEELPRKLGGCLDNSNADDRFLLAQVAEAASLLEGAIESASLLRLGKTPDSSTNMPAASAGHFGYVYERLGELRQAGSSNFFAPISRASHSPCATPHASPSCAASTLL